MRFFVSIVFLAGAALAQSVQTAVAFAPFGPWPICETNQSVPYLNNIFSSANYCSALTKGSEPDLLSIKSANSSTTDFLYIVTGVDSTGTNKTLTGHLKRKDNSAGYSSCIVDAGMTVALVTVVEYSYDSNTGTFLMLQNSSAYYH